MSQLNITSIGVLAGEIQAPVKQIAEVAKQLGIVPSARINNVPHFCAADVERIAAHIRTAEQLVPAIARESLS